MKGLFIPEITAEMFRNGCLESIENLMTEGEIYDIDYPLEQEPCEDCISRQDAESLFRNARKELLEVGRKEHIKDLNTRDLMLLNAEQMIHLLPSVQPKTEQEPKADYKAFAEWVAREVFSDTWELNKDAFAEIACRKLAKLGMVEESGDSWVLKESEVDE